MPLKTYAYKVFGTGQEIPADVHYPEEPPTSKYAIGMLLSLTSRSVLIA